MSQNILMPKLGNTVESVIIVEWRKSVGDVVHLGDIQFADVLPLVSISKTRQEFSSCRYRVAVI